MQYMLILLISFIAVLFIMQLILFEITRNKMKKMNNTKWFLSLDKPFHYNRVRYMFILCFICYLISSTDSLFSVEWFIYFFLFTAMGIVSDAVVQYLILAYSKKRCRKDIEQATFLQKELTDLIQVNTEDDRYEIPEPEYNEKTILKEYLQPTDHLAIISVDGGAFAQSLDFSPEAMFVIEPYGDIEDIKAKFDDESVKVMGLTPSGQMPFKDDKMDVVMCNECNYKKEEVQRVLKNKGYFIVNQRGTANYKEFLQLYMPFGMKGSWDAYSCSQTLESIGMKIVNKFEEYATIRFHSIQSLRTYFQRTSPDIANVEKYQMFYLKALQDIQKQNFFEITTHKFLIIAQKV